MNNLLPINERSTISFTVKTNGEAFSIDFAKTGQQYHIRELQPGSHRLTVSIKHPTIYKFSHPYTDLVIKKGLPKYINLPSAPKRERDYERPFDVKRNNNLKTVARIYSVPDGIYKRKTVIETGDLFEEMNYQQRLFALEHERAHFFYKDEVKADTLALINYLEAGFNPSNALYALTKFLKHSPANVERIKELFLKTTKVDIWQS